MSYLRMNQDIEWAVTSLRHTPYVVVRRAPASVDGYIPVGIRGTERNQREAAVLDLQGVRRIISPYEISQHQLWRSVPVHRQQLPVIQTLDQINEWVTAYRWGVTGSAGFELITGFPSIKVTSDLDLVIDDEAFTVTAAQHLIDKLDKLKIKIDIQLETKDGAYVLREVMERRARTVILRTLTGPQLVNNPWFS